MTTVTLESLAQRVAALEQQFANLRGVIPAKRDWQSALGMFERNEFNDRVDAEVAAFRAAQPYEQADDAS